MPEPRETQQSPERAAVHHWQLCTVLRQKAQGAQAWSFNQPSDSVPRALCALLPLVQRHKDLIQARDCLPRNRRTFYLTTAYAVFWDRGCPRTLSIDQAGLRPRACLCPRSAEIKGSNHLLYFEKYLWNGRTTAETKWNPEIFIFFLKIFLLIFFNNKISHYGAQFNKQNTGIFRHWYLFIFLGWLVIHGSDTQEEMQI